MNVNGISSVQGLNSQIKSESSPQQAAQAVDAKTLKDDVVSLSVQSQIGSGTKEPPIAMKSLATYNDVAEIGSGTKEPPTAEIGSGTKEPPQ